MIPEIDIWRVANLMLKRYGDLTEVESARRADELWEAGRLRSEQVADINRNVRPTSSEYARYRSAKEHDTSRTTALTGTMMSC